ncbi:MAG TPA: hypothetical protein DCO67_06080 [Staphylococcus sp.]|nr:hypothetical protein [Staphylococcus sp.]
MIKRTTERILIWIGIAVQIMILSALCLLIWYTNSKEAVKSMMETNTISFNEATSTLNLLSGFIIFELIWGVILMGLAITSFVWIGKKSKVAGMILIVIGILSIIINWIAVIMWIIAGSMLIKKKSKVSLYNEPEEEKENPFVANEKIKYDDEVQKDNKEEHVNKDIVEDPFKY